MTSTFSWSDTLHIAVNGCLPCLRRASSNDSLNNPQPAPHHLQRARPDELRGLLIDPESDSAVDTETLSLHSNPGFARRNKKKRVSTSGSQRRITLFGYDLFGRSAPPPIQLPNDDDVLYHEAPPLITPTLTLQSTATFDSDAAPLDAATIDNFSSSAAAARAEAEEEERRQREERRRLRKERKELKKMAQALALSGDDGFEGFQGSGDGYPAIPSPYLQVQQPNVQPQSQRPPSPTTLLPHLAIKEEDDDEGADLDGIAYTRRRAPGHSSNGGSDSRSRTSTSVSDRPSFSGLQRPYPKHQENRTQLKAPSSSPVKEKKSKSTSSNHSSSNRRSKSSRSSNSNNTTTDSTSLASPVSPSFLPEGLQHSANPSTTTILSPSTIAQGQGFFDLEDEPQVRVPAVHFTKSPNETVTVSERGTFPSTGLGIGFGPTGRSRGAFLANTASALVDRRERGSDGNIF